MMTNNIIPNNLYEFACTVKNYSFKEKIAKYSAFLLKTPYGAPKCTGEQSDKKDNSYNTTIHYLCKKPELTYSFDKLDCVTYVEVVIALANIKNEQYKSYKDFQNCFASNLKAIRYKNGNDTFISRNHFTSADWIPNNSKFLEDITSSLNEKSSCAKAKINKLNWLYKTYLSKNIENCPAFNEQALQKKFDEQGIDIRTKEASLNYITLADLIDNYSHYCDKFPEVSVASIVRPNWNLESSIGTRLNISHQGLVIKINNELIFRHATSVEPKQIVELKLIDYLKKYRNSQTIKGLNILRLKDSNAHILEKKANNDFLRV